MERITRNTRYLPLIITIIIFFIPFLWLKNGQMDLGGDSSRLYFYDPVAYLFNHSLYGISSSGHGAENISYYAIPFILLLVLGKVIFNSSTLLINIFHGFSLSVGFYSVYQIIKHIDIKIKKSYRKDLAGIISGILYIFSPTLVDGWDKAILTHNQFFINPLFFFILLRFFQTDNPVYIYGAVILSFIFSANFNYSAAPPFFAFFPLSIVFLYIYSYIILKKTPKIKFILIGMILFFIVQAFHLIPFIVSLKGSSSAIGQTIFSDEGKYSRGLSYFTAIAPSIRVPNNLLLLQQGDITSPLSYLFIFLPIIVIFALLKSKSRLLIITFLAFIVTLFFTTARITNLGYLFYQELFSIPGFSMFRNFYGQWVFSFTFYYVLLIGVSLVHTFNILSRKYLNLLALSLIILITINSIDFIIGNKINKILWMSNNIKLTIKMDPDYQKVLDKIKNLPVDGKILSLPLTDPGYQMFAGLNGGVYQGPSSISYLTGKKDFAGVQEIQPYGDILLNAIQKKNYKEVYQIFKFINIKYIFYNNDPYIYNNFPQFPYEIIKQTFPDDKSYRGFIMNLGLIEKVNINNKYFVFEVPDSQYTPHVYVPQDITYSNSPNIEEIYQKNDSSFQVSLPINSDKIIPGDIIVEPENTSAIISLADNYHHHTHDPYISVSPESILYPLILQKESFDISQKKKSFETYSNWILFTATKRISEITNYQSTMNIKSSSFLGKYNTWGFILGNYSEKISELISEIDRKNMPVAWKAKQRIIVNEQLEKHRLTLKNDIQNSRFTDKEKKYLYKMVQKIFLDLKSKLKKPFLDPFVQTYSLNLKNQQAGPFKVYLKNENNIQNEDKIKIDYNGKILKPLNITTQYIYFGEVPEISGKDKIKIDIPNDNETTLAAPNDLNFKNKTLVSSSSFSFNNQLTNNLGGVIINIPNWHPHTQYSISYLYKTENDDFIFKLYERKKERNGKAILTSLFEKSLESTNWRKKQTIMTSDDQSISAYLQIISRSDDENSGIQIKNLSVDQVVNPRILLIKNNKKVKNIPKITYQKINPTRYHVEVKNAKEPFILTLSDWNDSGWKIYGDTITNNSNLNQMTSISNDITHLILSKSLFSDNHYLANGYANSWVIDPKKIGMRDFNLAIVFTIQPIFYFSSVVSLIGICLVVLLFIKKLIWKRK